MKVTVDQDKCISAGQCVSNSSAVFDQREDDGVVVLLDENPPEHEAENVRRAAAECPASVITIEE
jgi:ferredoxin